MDLTTADGTRLYYERHGRGQPLLLVAGTGCDHLFWDHHKDDFARDFEVILVDTRGAGLSSVSPDPATYSSRVLADDLAELLVRLDLGPAHVLGHSLGSCIAQQLGLHHRDLVASLQLHATWAVADAWLLRAFMGTTRYVVEHDDPRATFRTVSMWCLSPDYLATREPSEVAAMVDTEFIRNPHLAFGAGLLGHLTADETHDTTAELGQLNVPTLVTAGELDYCIPARYGQQVAELVPDARFHLFEGSRSSHMYPWEMADEFAAVVRDGVSAGTR